MSRPDSSDYEPDQVVIRDKRRLDPDSGAVREPAVETSAETPPAPASAPEAQPAGDPGSDAVAELTADLQRLSAEYANYRKRVERDRVAVVEMATAGVVSELLPVLDDIDRARQHGDLTGPFQAVGDRLEALTAKLGLERYGEVGEPFDPAVHEALMQAEPDPSATVATCAQVLQPGYRMSAGRVLRPARVAVAEPGPHPEAAPADVHGQPDAQGQADVHDSTS